MQYPYPGGGQAPPKKSVMPWVLGGGCLLVVLGAGAFVVLVGVFAALGSSDAETTPAASTATGEGPTADLPPGPTSGSRFVNQRTGLDPSDPLMKGFALFSVDYPEGWTLKDERKGGYFAVISTKREVKTGVSVESGKVTFSWWKTEEGPKALIEGLDWGTAKPRFAKTKLAGRDGYEARTSVTSKLTKTTLLVRQIAIPEAPGGKRGLFIVAMAEAGQGMGEKPEDVGTQGALKQILDSLKVGDEVDLASQNNPCGYNESDNCMTCCSMFGHSRASGAGNRCNCL